MKQRLFSLSLLFGLVLLGSVLKSSNTRGGGFLSTPKTKSATQKEGLKGASSTLVEGNKGDETESPKTAPSQSRVALNEAENGLLPPVPTIDQVRKEAWEDSHSTPLSILAFAAELGPKIEHALGSEDAAAVLIKKLRVCAQDKSAPETIQGICLSNIELLLEAYPSLND